MSGFFQGRALLGSADEVIYVPLGPDSVSRFVANKLDEIASFNDKGAIGQGADETLLLQAALDANVGRRVSAGDNTFVCGALDTVGRIFDWKTGYYNNALSNGDAIEPENLSPAQAMAYATGGRYGYAHRNGNITANHVYDSIFPAVSHFDNVESTLQIAAGSTIENATAIAGFVENNSTGTNGVALSGMAKATVNNAKVWGINTLLQDAATRVAGTGTGRYLLGAELDFNIMNPATQVVGISMGGNSLAQPSNANAFIVNTLGNGNKWTGGLLTIDGAAQIAIAIGMMATAGNYVDSQPINFKSTDGAGAQGSVKLYGQAANYLVAAGGAGFAGFKVNYGDVHLDVGHGVQIGGEVVLSGRVHGWTAPTGTLYRGAIDGAYSPVVGAAYNQAEMQALRNALVEVRQVVAAIVTDNRSIGLYGT
jgi:hypothetical protein